MVVRELKKGRKQEVDFAHEQNTDTPDLYQLCSEKSKRFCAKQIPAHDPFLGNGGDAFLHGKVTKKRCFV